MPIIGRRGGAVIGSIGARHLTLTTVAVPASCAVIAFARSGQRRNKFNLAKSAKYAP